MSGDFWICGFSNAFTTPYRQAFVSVTKSIEHKTIFCWPNRLKLTLDSTTCAEIYLIMLYRKLRHMLRHTLYRLLNMGHPQPLDRNLKRKEVSLKV